MNKRTWLVVLVLATLLLAGCEKAKSELASDTVSADAGGSIEASATTATAPASEATASASTAATTTASQVDAQLLEVVESGYTIVDRKGPKVEYGVVMRNPNANFGVQYPVLRLTMLDANGQEIATAEQTMNRMVLPDETFSFAGEADANGKRPAKVVFEVLDPDNKWRTKNQIDPAGLMPFKVNRIKAGKKGTALAFDCSVENSNIIGIDDFLVSVILRDKAGRIVAGYNALDDEIGVKDTRTVQVETLGKVPSYAKVEAYVQKWEQ